MASNNHADAAPRVRVWWLVAACLLAYLSLPAGTQAHAGLAESDPPANAIVETAPASVSMTFTEPLEWSYTSAELRDQHGEPVSGTEVRPGANEFEMVLDLPPDLADGTYAVLWRTLSTADGHTAQNWFAFTIGDERDVVTVLEPMDESGGAPEWMQAIARWVALLGLAVVVALWPVWMFVVHPGLVSRGQTMRIATGVARRIAIVAFAVAVIGNLLALMVQAAELDGGWGSRISTTLFDTRFGDLWVFRIVLLAGLGIGMFFGNWAAPWKRPIVGAIIFALAFANPIPYSLISHASAQAAGRDVAIFNDYLHLIAASIWAGGLALLVTVLIPTLRGQDHERAHAVLRVMLPRFSTMALAAWMMLILSGVYSSWLQVGGMDALTGTDYGQRLIVKLLLLVPILGLAAFNLVFIRRRVARMQHGRGWVRPFVRAASGEIGIAVLVFLVVGSLTVQEPARQAVAASDEGSVETTLASGEREASLAVSPGAAGPNRLEVVFDSPPEPETEVLLRVGHDDRDTGEKELNLEGEDSGSFVYQGSELALPGVWTLELIVRPPDAFETRLYGEIELAAMAPAASEETVGPPWVLASTSAVVGMVLIVAGAFLLAVLVHQRRNERNRVVLGVGVVTLALGITALVLARTDVAVAIAQTLPLGS